TLALRCDVRSARRAARSASGHGRFQRAGRVLLYRSRASGSDPGRDARVRGSTTHIWHHANRRRPEPPLVTTRDLDELRVELHWHILERDGNWAGLLGLFRRGLELRGIETRDRRTDRELDARDREPVALLLNGAGGAGLDVRDRCARPFEA